MHKYLTGLSYFIVLLLWNLSAVLAQDFQVGQQVFLHAKKPVGVPLHHEPSPSYLKHVPNGNTAVIQHISKEGPWLHILLDSGEVHWIHRQYVRVSTAPSTPLIAQTPSSPQIPERPKASMGSEHAVWTSKEQCQAAVQKGLRMVEASSSTLRIATWNLRWFPIGTSPDRPVSSVGPTDIDWLICVLQWMQVDIVAIQESLGTPEAAQAWKTITSQLSTQAGETWRWYQQPCGRPDNHHIGLLWNDTRVALSDFDSLWQFNAKARSATTPCASSLRPGQYAYVQSRKKEGVNFHLIALHLKSGPTVFAVEKRQKALNRIDQTVKTLLDSDRDVVILGDFNTMGAGDWHSQKSEIKYIRRMVRKEKPGFEDLPLKPQCSHYFRGRGGWLDHVLVAKDMKEVTATSATVTGYCAIADCQRIQGDYPPAYRRLSDHCPVILEIANRTDD